MKKIVIIPPTQEEDSVFFFVKEGIRNVGEGGEISGFVFYLSGITNEEIDSVFNTISLFLESEEEIMFIFADTDEDSVARIFSAIEPRTFGMGRVEILIDEPEDDDYVLRMPREDVIKLCHQSNDPTTYSPPGAKSLKELARLAIMRSQDN